MVNSGAASKSSPVCCNTDSFSVSHSLIKLQSSHSQERKEKKGKYCILWYGLGILKVSKYLSVIICKKEQNENSLNFSRFPCIIHG